VVLCVIFCEGEEFLKNVSTQPGFLLLLLRLQEIKTVDPSLRLGAAVHFKNFVRSNWSQVVVFTPNIFIPLLSPTFCFY
jgi:hypothetical protein